MSIKSKTKYKILKIVGIVLTISNIVLITTIFVLFGCAEYWNGIEENGFASFWQWLSLTSYRLLLYLLPGLILSVFCFDKRYKYFTRLKIWLNWTFCLMLVANAIIKVFSIDIVLGLKIFNNLDMVVLLVGYLLTFISKEKVSFDSTEAIVNPKRWLIKFFK